MAMMLRHGQDTLPADSADDGVRVLRRVHLHDGEFDPHDADRQCGQSEGQRIFVVLAAHDGPKTARTVRRIMGFLDVAVHRVPGHQGQQPLDADERSEMLFHAVSRASRGRSRRVRPASRCLAARRGRTAAREAMQRRLRVHAFREQREPSGAGDLGGQVMRGVVEDSRRHG